MWKFIKGLFKQKTQQSEAIGIWWYKPDDRLQQSVTRYAALAQAINEENAKLQAQYAEWCDNIKKLDELYRLTA